MKIEKSWSNREVLGLILFPLCMTIFRHSHGLIYFISIISLFLSSGLYWGIFNKVTNNNENNNENNTK